MSSRHSCSISNGREQGAVQQGGVAEFGQAAEIGGLQGGAGAAAHPAITSGVGVAAPDGDLADVFEAGGELGEVAGGGLEGIRADDRRVAVEVDHRVAVAPAEHLAHVQVAVDADQRGRRRPRPAGRSPARSAPAWAESQSPSSPPVSASALFTASSARVNHGFTGPVP